MGLLCRITVCAIEEVGNPNQRYECHWHSPPTEDKTSRPGGRSYRRGRGRESESAATEDKRVHIDFFGGVW